MPFTKRTAVIDTEFVRVEPNIYSPYDPYNPYDAYVDSYVIDVYEAETFNINVRDVMVKGNPAPRIEIVTEDPDVIGVDGDVVTGQAPDIRVFGKDAIRVIVKAEN